MEVLLISRRESEMDIVYMSDILEAYEESINETNN